MDDTARGDANETARSVFAGLVPTTAELESTNRLSDAVAKGTKGLLATVPIVLVGSMAAFTLNLAGPIAPANARPTVKPRGAVAELGKTLRDAMASASVAIRSTSPAKTATALASSPTIYRVVAGDTVSEIAGRFGLSTASVLALNGLSWSSLIFPGQELRLTSHGPVVPIQSAIETAPVGRYTIIAGDTISAIADHFGVSTLSCAHGKRTRMVKHHLSGSDSCDPRARGSRWRTTDRVGRRHDNRPSPSPRRRSRRSRIDHCSACRHPSCPSPRQSLPRRLRLRPPRARARRAPVGREPHRAVGTNALGYRRAIRNLDSALARRERVVVGIDHLSRQRARYSRRRNSHPFRAGDIAGLTAEMRANAAIIVQVGRDLECPTTASSSR